MRVKKIKKLTKEDYYALPSETSAELMDGVLYDMSPVTHQNTSRNIYGAFGSYSQL